MSATGDEIQVDLDALDAKAAGAAVKNVDKGAKDAEKAPPKDAKGADAAKTDAAGVVSPEEGLEKLKKQLADEQTARTRAEQERDAARQRAREAETSEVRAKTDVQATQLDLVNNAITTVTQASDALEGKYAEAAGAGDWTAAAKIQREMATNAARLLALENGKKQLEAAPKPAPRASADPIEEYVGRIPAEYPRSRAWLRAHPDFVRDQTKNRQMLAAHELALARGETADTDGYFASIEDTLRLKAPEPAKNGAGEHEGDDPLTDAARPTGARTAAPAGAPPSRSGNGAGGARPNVVRLTAEQREIAQLNGMTDEEYARQVVALRNEGKLN